MKARFAPLDLNKIDFIKNLKNTGYSPYYTYSRIEDLTEIVRGNYGRPCSDTPKPVKVEGIDYILFQTKETGLIVDFAGLENNGKFELYTMDSKVYNEYEEYIKEFWVFEF